MVSALEFSWEVSRSVNFAAQQNDVRVVRSIKFHNISPQALNDLTLRVTVEPAIADDWEYKLQRLPPGQTRSLDTVALVFSPERLVNQSEAEKAVIRASISSDGQCLFETTAELEILAYNEWAGGSIMPELLAAFVLPGHPAIPPFLNQAADALGRDTGDKALSGYQSKDPSRVLQTTAALYHALQDAGISYINPQPSFEYCGQKIRTVDQLLNAKAATCLDIACLIAAAIEACGLHPIIVLVKGHAFGGVWLHKNSFPQAVLDDSGYLTKRIELDEIAVFDSSSMVQGMTFSQAREGASRYLSKPDNFHFLVDIQSARINSGIRPLPMRFSRHGQPIYKPVTVTTHAPERVTLENLKVQPAEDRSRPESATSTSRLQKWKDKLLDLSLRNRLLNFREVKATVQFVELDAATFEDKLAQGQEFQLLPKYEQRIINDDPRFIGSSGQRLLDAALKERASAELENGIARTMLTEGELHKRATEIFRSGRTSLEESGASTLYLAMGFLEWYEAPSSEKLRRAPILLLPIQIIRGHGNQPFRLKLHDDDPRVNVTLLKKLEKDFNMDVRGLDELPKDEYGLDIPKIFRRFREQVKDISRWKVVSECWIGQFSFTKFLMWLDLEERTEELKTNDVVQHILEGRQHAFGLKEPFDKPNELDTKRHPAHDFTVVDADAYQLSAVYGVQDGNSFVLQGPPGTGKSQTITNIIAQTLATGRTVLFVSEKMAALNVVYERLERVGLGPFCLELHSNKASKLGVINQLRESIDNSGDKGTTEWQQDAEQLLKLKARLNGYVDVLSNPTGYGLTVFGVLSELIGLTESPRVEIDWTQGIVRDQTSLMELREWISEFQQATQSVEPVKTHPWLGVNYGNWTPRWQDETLNRARCVKNSLEELLSAAEAASPGLKIQNANYSMEFVGALTDMSASLLKTPVPPSTLLETATWRACQPEVQEWLTHGNDYQALSESLSESFTDKVLDLDLGALKHKFDSWLHRNKILAFFVLFMPRRKLKRVCHQPKLPDNAAICEHLESAIAAFGHRSVLEEKSTSAAGVLGRLWKGLDTSWKQLSSVVDWVANYHKRASRLVGITDVDPLTLSEHKKYLAVLATDSAELVTEGGAYHRDLVNLCRAFKRLNAVIDDFQSHVRMDTSPFTELELVTQATVKTNGWIDNINLLRDWCAWIRERKRLESKGLGGFVAATADGRLVHEKIASAFNRSFYEWLYNEQCEKSEMLRQFRGKSHQELITRFRAADTTRLKLAQKECVARLQAQVPLLHDSGEPGLLKRELTKQRAHMPIRKLFTRIPQTLKRLKPCVLMSPLSVAQYLDPTLDGFDLVVFDEASQIPPWDAIGAIGRGSQTVIVGDSKQLPPTSFFQRMTDEDEDEYSDGQDLVDVDSILEEALASGLHSRPLLGHYRSQHESLIAFSNFHYYDNKLQTFPSAAANVPELGVHWVEVADGFYDRGRSRTNKAEAEAVVAEIVRRLSDPKECVRSLGVVTFSKVQQRLIEDLLDKARDAQPELEPFFGEEVEEPVFIKNLENVQGDERDVMMFSICYGPDKAGKPSMNFGPLNRRGGEKRLNVAVTRARQLLLVFSTVRPSQIDLSRTSSVGVEHLRTFLDYAARGMQALLEATERNFDIDFDSPFEEEVHRAVTRLGWKVHKQVGCSGYRIDLAVVHPDEPGRYALGIECDGATYHGSRCARERDRIRQSVLEGLGWTIHRIWSTDWWQDQSREVERVVAAIESAIRKSTKSARQQVSPRQATNPPIHSTKRKWVPPVARKVSLPKGTSYIVTTSVVGGFRDDFDTKAAFRRIYTGLCEVVSVESPIHREEAIRRVATAWGVKRLTKGILKHVYEAEKHCAGQEFTQHGDFYWKAGQTPAEYKQFRVPGVELSSRRRADRIPLEEIANAALQVLNAHELMNIDDLIKKTARCFDIRSVKRLVKENFTAALDHLLQAGSVTVAGENISISIKSS
jgi:very-short-patch-repair endonuclease